LRSSSGSLAMLAAMRRASSFGEQLGSGPAPRLILVIYVGARLPVLVLYDEACAVVFDRPGRREAASGWHCLFLVEPCRDDWVKPCLDDRECGYDGRNGSYRLNKCQEDNGDGPP